MIRRRLAALAGALLLTACGVGGPADDPGPLPD